jgi:hypothetical protein
MAVPGMTGGDQKPLVKFNAKSGKWHIDDQVVDKITMLVDLENAECGWVLFREGVAPDFRLVPMASLVAGGAYPPMPADVDSQGKPLFRRGFRMLAKISDQLAKGHPTVREWASGSLATVRGVDQLHTAFLAGRQDGKVPVVTTEGYKQVAGQYGANFEPILKILKWIDRPADFRTAAAPPASAPTASEPPPHVTDVPGEPEAFDEQDESPW